MPKPHRQFVCTACGGTQPRWAGKCPDCGEWNTLEERILDHVAEDLHRPTLIDAPSTPTPLGQITADSAVRWATGLSEFDRVLGGGLVAGSAVLIGGDPGVGKSTLALQVARELAAGGRKTIYITSEESPGQVRLRAERLTQDAALKSQHAPRSDVLVMAQSNLDVILNQLRQNKPDAVIVDSIQMVYRPDLPSVPGSATQLRDCAARLVWLAKQTGFALLLVGHVTKEGAIAGPKVLEHIVDCVVYFEGERFASHRLIRAAKNRFGSTDELGVFEMTDAGLRAVDDPSKLFLDTARTARPGSVILAACEGTRVLLVEVQALCVQSVFGAAKRKATGVDANRVAMILAVIEKHAGCVLGDQDVFVNIVGGIKVIEPAADLAIALAVVGAMTNRSLPEGAAVFGELGLGGELRGVHHAPRRTAETARIGLNSIILPEDRRSSARESPRRSSESPAHPAESKADNRKSKLNNHPCRTLADAIRQLA